MVKCGIYKIENTANGDVYIGSSSNLSERLCHHRHYLRHGKYENRHLLAAWRKYGESSFNMSVVEECPEGELVHREDFWIAFYDSKNRTRGYNIEDAFHPRHSEETRRMIGLLKQGNKYNLGRHPSAETIEKISKTMTGVPFTEERRLKIDISARSGKNHPMWGKHHSKSAKLKMAFAKKGIPLSEIHKKKIGDSHRGIKSWNFGGHLSKRTRKLISDKLLGSKNPNWGRPHPASTILKMSAVKMGANNPMSRENRERRLLEGF